MHTHITHLWMSPAAKNPEAQLFTKTSILVTDVCHNDVASGHIKVQIFSASTSSSPRVSAIFNCVKTRSSSVAVAVHRRSIMLGPLIA